MKIVTYIRVSTDKQGRSGLGLEGQQAAIAAFTKTANAVTVAEFCEVESGRNNDRPELAQALKMARVYGATLVIAKLDRLSRNAEFLLFLQRGSVPLVFCDMPEANHLTVGIMAVVAEAESRMISARTKTAMLAAKERGATFGNPNGADALRRAAKGNAASRESAITRADARAHDLSEALQDVIKAGHITLQKQANELNKRGITTPRGGKWYASSVSNLQARLLAA